MLNVIRILALLALRLILLIASPVLLLIAIKEWMEDNKSLADHLRICWASYWYF